MLVPESIKSYVLKEHASHFGVVKMKMIARSYVWWPGVNKDIEDVALSCAICVRERKTPSAVALAR